MNQQHQFTQNRAIPAHMLSSAMHPNMTSMQQMHQQHNVMVCGPSATPSATNISISNPSMVSHSYQQQQPPPQMVHQMPTNVNPQQQPNPQPQTHQPAPQFVNVPVSSAPVAHNTQSATIASISSATEGPTEVVGRLKMLTEKMLRASIMKVLDTAAMSVNNQGGRDNGTADVMSSTGSSATSDKDSVSSLNSKYSNVPLAQDVEESMSILDQIEVNLQLSVEWGTQMRLMEKYCVPPAAPYVESPTSSSVPSNVTTEGILSSYDNHEQYAKNMQATLESFMDGLTEDSNGGAGIGRALNTAETPSLPDFPVSLL